MLRITSEQKGAAAVLRLEGWPQGQYVAELRRSSMEAPAERRIVVELSDVRFVAPAGKALLAEMLRAGVKIFGRDALIRAIRDEVAASVLPKKGRRQIGSTDESDR